MSNQADQPPINVIQFPSEALENINRLLKNQLDYKDDEIEIEIIFGISKTGRLSVLDGGNKDRRYLVTDQCTKQDFVLEPLDSSEEFALRKGVPIEKSDQIVKDLTMNKTVKKVKPLGITLYTESGCGCDEFGCIHWD